MARIPVARTLTSRLDIPVKIIYKCPYCGYANSIDTIKRVEGSATGTIIASRDKLEEKARVALSKNIEKLNNQVMNRRYKELQLKVACGGCNKKAPWARYLYMGNIKYVLMLCMLIFLLIAIYAKAYGLLGAVIVLGSLFVISFVKEKKINKEFASMVEENFPQIFFVQNN